MSLVGSSSASQSSTLTSTGPRTTVISNSTRAPLLRRPDLHPGGFMCSTNCVTETLRAGQSCSITASFAPSALGPSPRRSTSATTRRPAPRRSRSRDRRQPAAPGDLARLAGFRPGSRRHGAAAPVTFHIVKLVADASPRSARRTRPGRFRVQSDLPATIPANSECTASVDFAPTVAGLHLRQPLRESGSAREPHGHRSAAGLSSTALCHRPRHLYARNRSADAHLQLTNSGNAPLTFSSIAVTRPSPS